MLDFRLDSWALATVITTQCFVFSALGARTHAAATVHVLRGFALVSSRLRFGNPLPLVTLDLGPEESLSLEAHVAMIGTSGNLSSLVSFSSRSPVSSTTPHDTSHLLVYASSTFTDLNTPFSISYGLGAARVDLGQDSVQFAGAWLRGQRPGVRCRHAEIEQPPHPAGLRPHGPRLHVHLFIWGDAPLVSVGESSGTLDQPLMAFQLTRFGVDVQNAYALEPGGTCNLGAMNASLYTGGIDYHPIPEGQEGYWIQELAGLTVNGQPVTLDAGSASYAAIDTGTTRVGGPADSTSALYAQIPGSETLTDDNTGYYMYPCDTNVTVTMKFGNSSISWPISNADFLLMQIIGDTLLKNVYSVLRTSPGAVGFAQLSSTATSMNGQLGPAPSPTVGTVATGLSRAGARTRARTGTRTRTLPCVSTSPR
ncbi:acid protease [Lentinus brumalis]|uniref:Acid protease n=1 Tax=Lentinus brumalis TaxID=2498619 RepID=A0A371DAU8_9APHY|nr:acid protease [Polyporus brumalis]